MNKLLIIGAAGFTGRHQLAFFKNNLSHSQTELIAVDRIDPLPKNSQNITWRKVNALNPTELESLIVTEKPAYIINFAGLFASDHFQDLYQANVELPQRLLEIIRKNAIPIQKLLLIGSAAEYGKPTQLPISEDAPLNPVNPYGLSKVYQTQLAQYYHRNYGIPVVIARTFNVTGDGLSPQLSIGSFAKQIAEAKNGDTLYVGNIDTKRDFLAIEDVVRYYNMLLFHGTPGEIYNVCSGNAVSIRSLLDAMILSSGKILSIATDPTKVKSFDVPEIYGNPQKLFNIKRQLS